MTMSSSRLRTVAGFVILFLLYQSSEAIGARLLHNNVLAASLMAAAFIAAWPVGRGLGYKGFDAYALSLKWPALRLLTGGLLLMGAVRLAAVFWGLNSGVYAIGTPAPAHVLALPLVLLGAALTTFIPSVAEDILTRGFWLEAARIRWAGWSFILATSLIYVLNHVFHLADPLEWIRLFCFGLAYATAAWKWRSLWAAVGLHWGWNLSNALLDIFITLNNTGPAVWLSAGAHLVTAAIIWLWPKPNDTI